MHLVPPSPPETVTPATRHRIVSATADHLLGMLYVRIGEDDKHGLAPDVLGELIGGFYSQSASFSPAALEDTFSKAISSSFSSTHEVILGLYRHLDEYGMTPDMPWIEEITDRQACVFENSEEGLLGLLIKAEGQSFAVLFHSESIYDPESSFSPFHIRRLDASLPLAVVGRVLQKEGALMSLVMDTSVSYIASFTQVQVNPIRWHDPKAFKNWDAISASFASIQSLAETLTQ